MPDDVHVLTILWQIDILYIYEYEIAEHMYNDSLSVEVKCDVWQRWRWHRIASQPRERTKKKPNENLEISIDNKN